VKRVKTASGSSSAASQGAFKALATVICPSTSSHCPSRSKSQRARMSSTPRIEKSTSTVDAISLKAHADGFAVAAATLSLAPTLAPKLVTAHDSPQSLLPRAPASQIPLPLSVASSSPGGSGSGYFSPRSGIVFASQMLLQKHEEIASLERLEAECLSRDGLSLLHKCDVCGSCFATALAASEHTSHKHAALLVAIAANTGKGKAKAWAAKGK
jgi:hypothetical protein